MAVAQFAIGAASAAVSYMGQQAQYEQQQQIYENNREEANKAATETYASTQNRILQERAAASQEAQRLNVDAAKGRATAATAAGESGVAGLSVDALIADFYGQEGRYERTLTNNLQMQEGYLVGEMDATKAQATSRINSVDQGTPPSFAEAAIRIGSSALDSFGTYNRMKTTGY